MKSDLQDEMRGFYETSAYHENALEVFANLQSPFQRYRISKVLGIHTPGPGDEVVDLGCGWGTFCFALADRCRRIVGVDGSPRAISLCERLRREHGCENVSFLQADVRRTGLPPSSFDAAICADLVEHLFPDAYEELLDEAHRLLKPGGKLVLWTPHAGHLFEVLKASRLFLKPDPSHVDYKSLPVLLRSLQAHGFSVLRAYYAESHWKGFRWVERGLGRMVPLLRRRIAVLAEKR